MSDGEVRVERGCGVRVVRANCPFHMDLNPGMTWVNVLTCANVKQVEPAFDSG